MVSGGWTRVYYHRGESVRLRGGGDGLLRRLAAVAPTHAHTLAEITLERGAQPQLGNYTPLPYLLHEIIIPNMVSTICLLTC